MSEQVECDNCAGCGKVADDPDQTPWKYFEETPTQSAVGIGMGWIKPITCPECEGSGKVDAEVAA